MYHALLVVHSWLRWIIVILAAIVLVTSLGGWLSKRAYSAGDKRNSLLLLIAMDTQLLLGFVLYFALSPYSKAALANMGAAMKDSIARFWAVEHTTAAIAAVVAVHVSRILAKKTNDDTAKHRRIAIGVLIAILMVMFAIPWPFLLRGAGRPWLRF